MQSPGAVTHPGWGLPRVGKTDTPEPTGQQHNTRYGGVAPVNVRTKTKFGISKANSASTKNDVDPMVGDAVLMADFRYDLQQQNRFANRQLGANLDFLVPGAPAAGGSVPNRQGLVTVPRQVGDSSQAQAYHPYFTDGVQAHTIDYKNTPVEKLSSAREAMSPPVATPPRQSLGGALENRYSAPYPPTNTQIEMRNIRDNMMAMLEGQLAQQGHLGKVTARANQLEYAPEHIKNIAANLIQQYDSIDNSNVSHAEFQHNMSNLPSTIKAEKLRSPSRNIRRGDLTWPENDLRFLPPSPKAVPISSSINQTDGEDQIASEPVAGLKDAPKPTFDGTTAEWERYLSSRKSKDDEGKDDLPDNIVDGNKVIQEKLKDIVAMKVEINAKHLQESRKAEWKAYNQYEQFAGEDIVRFEETMDPQSKKTPASETEVNTSANVHSQVPTHQRFSNTIPPPLHPSARQPSHFEQQQQPQPQMLRPTARAFYDSLDGPFDANFQPNNTPFHHQQSNVAPMHHQQYNAAHVHHSHNYPGAPFDVAEERMIDVSLGLDCIDDRAENFHMPKISRVPIEQIQRMDVYKERPTRSFTEEKVKSIPQKRQEHVPPSTETVMLGQMELYPNQNKTENGNFENGLRTRRFEQQSFQLSSEPAAEDEILKRQYAKLKNMVMADCDISHGNFPQAPQSSTAVRVRGGIRSSVATANPQPVKFDIAQPVKHENTQPLKSNSVKSNLNVLKDRPFSNFLHRNNADEYIMQHPLARQMVSSFALVRNSEKAHNLEQSVQENNTAPKTSADVPEVVEDDSAIEIEYRRLQAKAKSRVLQSKKKQDRKKVTSVKAPEDSNESKGRPTYFDPDRDMYKNKKTKPVTRKMWEKKSMEKRQIDLKTKQRRERLRRQQKTYRRDNADSSVATRDQENRAIPEDSSSDDEEISLRMQVEKE